MPTFLFHSWMKFCKSFSVLFNWALYFGRILIVRQVYMLQFSFALRLTLHSFTYIFHMYVSHLWEKHLWLIFNSHLRIRLRAGCADRCIAVFEGSYYYLGQLPETISFAEWNVYLDATTVGYYKRSYKWGITIQDSVCFPVHHGCLMIVYFATFILYYWKVRQQWPWVSVVCLVRGELFIDYTFHSSQKSWENLRPYYYRHGASWTQILSLASDW